MTLTKEEILEAKILLVDDEPLYGWLLEETLRTNGYKQIQRTTNPKEVVDIYNDFDPDLILLDLQMPEMDGFEVMRRLKAIEKRTYLPILVLTGNTDREIRLRALESGAKDFLIKPFDQIEVLNRIHNLLEVRLLHKAVLNQNQQLACEVDKKTREVRSTQLEIIRRLCRAAEFRDDETGAHVIRMSLYSTKLGRALDFGDAEAELLLNATPMHDVGKIGIPDRILFKSGKLNEDEWTIMQTHTTIGARLLSGHESELMQMAQRIALTHHERWDGSGYPLGLKAEDIPLEGRIAALGDAFDALTTERPYKPAWSVEDAVAEIEAQKGKHFDPKLADMFIKILPEILEIKNSYEESPVRKFSDGLDYDMLLHL